MGVVIRRWVWLETIGVVSGCFPHILNTYGEEHFLSPSAITTVSWQAFTTPDPSIALDSAPVYNDAAVLARAIRIRVASNPSLPV